MAIIKLSLCCHMVFWAVLPDATLEGFIRILSKSLEAPRHHIVCCETSINLPYQFQLLWKERAEYLNLRVAFWSFSLCHWSLKKSTTNLLLYGRCHDYACHPSSCSDKMTRLVLAVMRALGMMQNENRNQICKKKRSVWWSKASYHIVLSLESCETLTWGPYRPHHWPTRCYSLQPTFFF